LAELSYNSPAEICNGEKAIFFAASNKQYATPEDWERVLSPDFSTPLAGLPVCSTETETAGMRPRQPLLKRHLILDKG